MKSWQPGKCQHFWVQHVSSCNWLVFFTVEVLNSSKTCRLYTVILRCVVLDPMFKCFKCSVWMFYKQSWLKWHFEHLASQFASVEACRCGHVMPKILVMSFVWHQEPCHVLWGWKLEDVITISRCTEDYVADVEPCRKNRSLVLFL